ncbi:hypothetical protein CCACVL1_22577, partial [Corchorus capsularis]
GSFIMHRHNIHILILAFNAGGSP